MAIEIQIKLVFLEERQKVGDQICEVNIRIEITPEWVVYHCRLPKNTLVVRPFLHSLLNPHKLLISFVHKVRILAEPFFETS